MHLDRDGMAVFGQRGVHRFVIASVLGLEQVVAQLGVVHPLAPQASGFRWRPRRPLTALLAPEPRPPARLAALQSLLQRRRQP